MKCWILILPLIGSALTGCDTIKAMRCNQQAVEMSTHAICKNKGAIEEANRAIDENRIELEAINERLNKMNGS